MEPLHRFLLIFELVLFSISTVSNVEGDTHFRGEPMNAHSSYFPATDITSVVNIGINQTTFDVKTFGAVGDGLTDDTVAFMLAWKATCEVESGVLLAPANSVFMITSTSFNGPCKPGFTFQVDGVLMPPSGPDLWPKTDNPMQWLVFNQVDRMSLRGNGTIRGNGEEWWELPCKPHRGPNGTTLAGPCDSPALIMFFMSSNLLVSDLHIINSPQFHIKFDNCKGVLVQNLNIYSPAFSPNTDGIHIENTISVGISNCNIANGDDCISIGAGCSDVHIDNVTCIHSHGISIGSLGMQNTQACLSNITVRNAAIIDSENGVRIKTWQGGYGSVSNITFQDIGMYNVKNCIIVDQYYCLTKDCQNQTSAVSVNNISYKNIKGTYNVLSKPIHIACSDSVPCTNITISDVELLPEDGRTLNDPFCWNAYGTLQTQTIPLISCLLEGMPESISETSIFACSKVSI